MSRLVMKDSVDIIADAGFVNTKTVTRIFLFEHPFLCMVLLIPASVVAQDVLVVLLKSIAINAIGPS